MKVGDNLIMKKYKCIIQDTFGKLEVGKIYYIEDNWLYNNAKTIKIYRVNDYMLKCMFEEVQNERE